MNRLTYKLNAEEQKEHRSRYIHFEYLPIPDYDIKRGNYDRITTDMIYNKLGRLEDLEEQIGCPLEILIKAILHGIYILDNRTRKLKFFSIQDISTRFEEEITDDGNMYLVIGSYDENVEVDQYKKTWWLKEDKSE